MKLLILLCSIYSALVCNGNALAQRNPFACTHEHGTYALQHARGQAQGSKESSKSKLTNAMVDDTETEWRLLAEKDGAMIMQHKDGSIREITINQ